MNRLRLLLSLAFIESFATICVERGIYFFTDHSLNFEPTHNLLLALGFGLAYAVGASASHALAGRLGERRLLIGTIVAQLLLHLALAQWLDLAGVVVAATIGLGMFNGAKWPLIESYIAAGKAPRQQAAAVGKFNIAWSLAVVPALVVAGPLIDHAPAWLFLLPAGINLASAAMCLPLRRRPLHLDIAHPERPSAQRVAKLGALLVGSRWLMLASYVSLFLLSPLMPEIFSKLGVPLWLAPGLSSVMDVFRIVAFVTLAWWTGWHERRSPLVLGMLGMVAGVFIVLLVPSVAAVLAGEVLFGFSAGVIYYGALYYAVVVKNASVEAGGAHETLIGLGFALGPVGGLAAAWLTPVLGSLLLGTLAGVAPPLVVCSLVALWPLTRAAPFRSPGPRG
jgi:MFS family permease